MERPRSLKHAVRMGLNQAIAMDLDLSSDAAAKVILGCIRERLAHEFQLILIKSPNDAYIWELWNRLFIEDAFRGIDNSA